MEKIIEVDISCNENLYEKYNKKIVSKDLINYLVLSTPMFSKKDKLKVIINNETKENDVIRLIKEGLLKEYKNSLNRRIRNNIIQFVYLLIGIFGLYISTLITEAVFKEVVLIGGWVFICALLEIELITDRKGRIKRKTLQKLLKGEFVEK